MNLDSIRAQRAELAVALDTIDRIRDVNIASPNVEITHILNSVGDRPTTDQVIASNLRQAAHFLYDEMVDQGVPARIAARDLLLGEALKFDPLPV
jgi:hypothetical protein